jgi:hypothetical protein
MAKSQDTPTGFPADGKGFNENIVEGLSFSEFFAELIGKFPCLRCGLCLWL